MVPNVRFELTTYRLQGGCSTTELIRHNQHIRKYVVNIKIIQVKTTNYPSVCS